MKLSFHLDTLKINNDYFEEKIKKNKKDNKCPNMNNFLIRVLVLKSDKTTTIEIVKNTNIKSISFQNENNDSISNIMNSYQLNNSSFINQPNNSLLNINQSSDSTFFDSKLGPNANNSIVEYKHPLNQFNSIRSNFYSKNKLNDIPLSDEINNFNNNNNYPPIYSINGKLFAFVYPNNLITYNITISAFLANNNILNYDLNQNLKVNESQYYPLLGLYFCGKIEEIKIENKVHNKKCLPNEFLCKKCLLINKRKYNLKNSYIININGRVAKMNKGSYHCFGHFLSGNQIEDCINRFSCKSCKLINEYLDYYIN